MRVKHAALKEALTGQFDDHHAEFARMLLEEIEGLAAKIDRLTTRIDELISQLPGPMTPTDSGGGQGSGSLSVVERLDDLARGHAPRRRGDRGEPDAGVLEHLLQALDLPCTRVDLGLAVAGELADLADLRRGDEGGTHHAVRSDIGQPFSVRQVALSARHVWDV